MVYAMAVPQIELTETSKEKPLGIDVSANQAYRDATGKIILKHMGWNKVAAHKPAVMFAGIRAGISWQYVDPAFAYNRAECKRLGIPQTAYHVFYPNEDPILQAQHFVNVMGTDFGEIPPTADVELGEYGHKCTPAQYQKALLAYLVEIELLTKRRPLIYSRANFINYYVTGSGTPPSWLNEYDWWLAQYLSSGAEHQGPPALPAGVDRERCVIQQTSDRGPGKTEYGTMSASIDLNRWQLSQSALSAFLYGSGVVELTMEERVARLEKAVFG